MLLEIWSQLLMLISIIACLCEMVNWPLCFASVAEAISNSLISCQKKIHDHTKYITAQEFNKLTGEYFV